MRTFLLVLLASVATPAVAGSQGDWFASLYTGEGVELRNDERVFALFALLNAGGFDQGPITRREPVPKVQYSPVRQQVRAHVLGGDPELRKAVDTWLDAHPVALRRYLAWAVQSDGAPFVAGAKSKDLNDLKGFEQILAKVWVGWKLDELMGQVQGEYRKVLKSYLTVIDGPLEKARTLLKVPENTEVLLVVNLLDAQNEVRVVAGEGSQVFVVVGPSDKPNVEGLVREFARLWVEPAVAKQVSKWSGGAATWHEAQLVGASDSTVQDFAASVVSQSVALRALDSNDAAYEAAAARGYFGAKDIAKQFDDGKPLDGWVLEALQKVETRRPAKK